jgi:ATP-dependent DNA helicase RecQ
MKDQIDFLRGRGINAARLDSSLSAEESRQTTNDLLSGELKLLYVAPERFNNERFLQLLSRAPLALLALDEAHCISEWGHNFRPDYLKLAGLARQLKVPRVLALTATATPEVARSICAEFDIPEGASINTGFYRPNLQMALTPTPASSRDELLAQRLGKRKPGTTIIYVTLQKTAMSVAAQLRRQGLDARAYHAGLDTEVRNEIQEWWMGSDSGIVVATIAFGMGIDKSDVRYVYHYNLPKSLENYSQEIGRAGRDGQASVVELLACPDDVPTLQNFVYGDTPTAAALEGLLQELLGLGESFVVEEHALSKRHDMRPLVLRTALTYLELAGVIQQGTPYYASYDIQLNQSRAQTLAAFGEKAGRFLQALLETGRKGTKWIRVQPETACEALGTQRTHLLRALELLQQKGLAQVKATEVRQRFARLDYQGDIATLTRELVERFTRREASEIRRLEDVLRLVEDDGCQTNALVSYFGQERSVPCGHCSYCKRGHAVKMPQPRPLPPLETRIGRAGAQALAQQSPQGLGHPRQLARYLCGIKSPAQPRLPDNSKFAVLEEYRFADVLEWCSAGQGEYEP